jgi:hypothetical protein
MKIYIVNSQINNNTKSFLRNHGTVAEVSAHPVLASAEKYHADMQFARIDSHTIIAAPFTFLTETNGLDIIQGSIHLKEKYPENISYNILRFGNYIIHNTKHTAAEVISEAQKRHLKIIHTKQGYAGCSSISVPLSNNKTLVISSDNGLISTLNKLDDNNIHTEYFEDTKSILLPGYDHGFIGGCCGYDEDLGLLVYGKINGQLKELSEKYNFPILSIFDGPLTDIGGILVMYPCL